jgi:hypothetical protein
VETNLEGLGPPHLHGVAVHERKGSPSVVDVVRRIGLNQEVELGVSLLALDDELLTWQSNEEEEE